MFDPHLGLHFLQAKILLTFCVEFFIAFGYFAEGDIDGRATFLPAANLKVSDEAKSVECNFPLRLGINGPQSDLISSNRCYVSVFKSIK